MTDMTEAAKRLLADAEFKLQQGATLPYDAPDSWWDDEKDIDPPAPLDWAHAAARGVIADLQDRRGIKQELAGVDQDVRAEIVDSLALIIRLAEEKRHG